MDSDISDKDSFTLQGDLLLNRRSPPITFPSAENPPTFTITTDPEVKVTAGNILGRWIHKTPNSEWTLQSYFNYEGIKPKELQSNDVVRTFDIDFKYSFLSGDIHTLTWGLGYRSIDDHLDDLPSSTFTPKKTRLDYYSLFL